MGFPSKSLDGYYCPFMEYDGEGQTHSLVFHIEGAWGWVGGGVALL